MAVKCALFDLTPNLSHFMAIVQGQASVTMEDIIARMTGRGSTATKAEALGVMDQFEASELLAEGHNVNTPLFSVGVSTKGVFNQEEEIYTAGSRISQISSRNYTLEGRNLYHKGTTIRWGRLSSVLTVDV